MAWSFIAQRATTGEFLDWDVPLELGGMEWQLSGPGSLKATIEPDVGGLRASDGSLILEEWGTLLHAEHDGVIRWSGIVISSSFNGDKWDLEAAGYSTYPHAVTYEGDFSAIQIDPVTVIRHIWEHIQSYPDGNLHVTVTGTTDTGVRMGTPAIPAQVGVTPPETADVVAARMIADRIELTDEQVFEDWTWHGCSQEVAENNDVLLDAFSGNSMDPIASVAFLRQYVIDHAPKPATEADDVEAEPYELVWTESTNCGAEIDDLAKLAPLDFVERHYWNADHEDIVHEIELAFPRAGRRREDIVFVQGDNVLSVITVESNGDEFANTVIGLGAGEGRAMVRRETSLSDGRLRRVYVHVDKSLTDTARLDAAISEELNARRAALRVEAVDVIDHPNAPIGSWELGDDVLVRAELPWLGEIEVWCRVVGWTLTGENTASLSLVRSDLYRYGGVPVDSA